ncbi:MAG: DNA pilot protein [Microviridae sp.]|nr:MAG: DNA pilot protein [Microviridae sp.]
MKPPRSPARQRGFWQFAIPAIAAAVGGIMGNDRARKAAHEANDLQERLSREGIQRRVADAKAAGIHPLYALGANTGTYSPAVAVQDYSWLGNMGQDIGRAMMANGTDEERIAAAVGSGGAQSGFDSTSSEVQPSRGVPPLLQRPHEVSAIAVQLEEEHLRGARLTNANLEAELLLKQQQLAGRARRLSTGGGQLGPSVPSEGAIKVDPSETTSTRHGDPSTEAADAPAFKKFDIGDGWKLHGFGEKSQESFESAEVLGNIILSAKNFNDLLVQLQDRVRPAVLRRLWEMRQNLMFGPAAVPRRKGM